MHARVFIFGGWSKNSITVATEFLLQPPKIKTQVHLLVLLCICLHRCFGFLADFWAAMTACISTHSSYVSVGVTLATVCFFCESWVVHLFWMRGVVLRGFVCVQYTPFVCFVDFYVGLCFWLVVCAFTELLGPVQTVCVCLHVRYFLHGVR